MSRECEDFRLHLEDLQAAFPGQRLITKRQLAQYLGVRVGTIYEWDIPTVASSGQRQMVPIIGAARWLSGGGTKQ